MGLTNRTRAVLAGSSPSLPRLWPRPPLFATLPPLFFLRVSLPQDGRRFLKRHLGRASSAPKLSVAHHGERESDGAEYIFVIGLNWWARNMPPSSRGSFVLACSAGWIELSSSHDEESFSVRCKELERRRREDGILPVCSLAFLLSPLNQTPREGEGEQQCDADSAPLCG